MGWDGHVALVGKKCIFYKVMNGEHEERGRLEDAGIDGRIILNKP
jgi:hypothetical protein